MPPRYPNPANIRKDMRSLKGPNPPPSKVFNVTVDQRWERDVFFPNAPPTLLHPTGSAMDGQGPLSNSGGGELRFFGLAETLE